MDSIDRKILAELQADGRLSLTELAERVNLSLSPCHRRVRALEQSGAITGYRANLDPANRAGPAIIWRSRLPDACCHPRSVGFSETV